MFSEMLPWGLTAAFAVSSVCLLMTKKKNDKIDFRKILSGIDNAAYIIADSKSHIVLYVSDHVTPLFGLPKDSVMSDLHTIFWCMTDDDRRAFMQKLEACEDKFSFECVATNFETKEEIQAKTEVKIIDKYIMIKLAKNDEEVEERRKTQEEMEQIKSEEMQKTFFLSQMSHEIRTPMNGILGMIKLAKANSDSKEELTNCLDKANGLAQFLLSLINDILDLTKIESGKAELEHERFDLCDIFDKLGEIFGMSIEQKGIKFEMQKVNLNDRYVLGDSLRLMQILTNLLSNASKYTYKGGTISVTFEEMNRVDDTAYMLFKIKDNGKGMDPKFLSNIFKPFTQEEKSTTRKFGGTGLGMAIVDNLVKLMQGSIVVDTAIGKGSEFLVYLPFDVSDEPQVEADKGSAGEIVEGTLDGLKILCAEDNAINAEILVEILNMEGVSTDVAENGKIAVDMFKSHPDGYYDVVLMDIQMPEMDGWTATKVIREIDSEYARKTPIFALSADAFVEDKRHSVEVGMNGHISKPINFDELKKSVISALNEKK